MNHPENNLFFTNQLFKLFIGSPSYSYTDLRMSELVF